MSQLSVKNIKSLSPLTQLEISHQKYQIFTHTNIAGTGPDLPSKISVSSCHRCDWKCPDFLSKNIKSLSPLTQLEIVSTYHQKYEIFIATNMTENVLTSCQKYLVFVDINKARNCPDFSSK